jgi:hypothetical protein
VSGTGCGPSRRRAAKKVINSAREAVLAPRDSATLGLVGPLAAVCFVQPGSLGEANCFASQTKGGLFVL